MGVTIVIRYGENDRWRINYYGCRRFFEKMIESENVDDTDLNILNLIFNFGYWEIANDYEENPSLTLRVAGMMKNTAYKITKGEIVFDEKAPKTQRNEICEFYGGLVDLIDKWEGMVNK